MTILAALAVSATAAVAQTPAVKSPNTNNPAAPVAGANSFTEGQAKSRIESNGYSNVSDLKKDDSGIWTGTAMKGGQKVNVRVDFQGNVVTR
jgi:opacity protein-like surface antigen